MYHKAKVLSLLFSFFLILCISNNCFANITKPSIILPNLYIAPDGDDSNPGTEEKPFATFERAQQAVRSFKRNVPKPITVYAREGTYYLLKPIVFTSADSGTDLQPITYASYPGEKPTISGGTKLEAKWEPYRDGIMKCTVPAGMDFDQLFINGKRQRRARYPNFDPEKTLVTEGGTGYIYGSVNINGDKVQLTYDTATFSKKKWADPQTGIVHYFPGSYYFNLQFELKELNYDTNIILFGKGGWQRNMNKWGPVGNEYDCFKIIGHSPFFVDNILEELNIPGEWFLDKKNSTLYYMPKAGTDLKNAKIEVPQLKHLVEIKGNRRFPIRNINFDGFQFAHTKKTFLEPYVTPGSGDFGVYWGGAVVIEGAEYCAIENSLFHEIGGNGVFVGNYNRHIRMYGNTFSYCGDNAICIIGKTHIQMGKHWVCPQCGDDTRYWVFGELNEDFPAYCDVSNNLIHHIGAYGKQVAGVLMAMTMKNTVSHNNLHSMPRSAICVSDPFWGGHIIEYNDINDTNLETLEHGPISSWGRGEEWCPRHWAPSPTRLQHTPGDSKKYTKFTNHIRNNRICEQSKTAKFAHRPDHNSGINMDDGSSNFHIYNNLCLGAGTQNREGSYRVYENNIFIEPQCEIRFQVGFIDHHDKFIRNIVVIRQDKNAYLHAPERFVWDDGPWVEEMDYNLFYREKPATSPLEYKAGQNIPLGNTSSWIVTEGKICTFSNWCGMVATDGNRFLHLGKGALEGGVARSFATEIGKTYKLSFDAWQNIRQAVDGSLDITVGDLVMNNLAVADYAVSGATHLEYIFTATDTTSTLHFHNDGGVKSAMNIDNVSVVSASGDSIIDGSFEISKENALCSFEWFDRNNIAYDSHSLFADPMFVDPANGDYRVKPDSSALKLGFKNFDVSGAGLLPDFTDKWDK